MRAIMYEVSREEMVSGETYLCVDNTGYPHLLIYERRDLDDEEANDNCFFREGNSFYFHASAFAKFYKLPKWKV